MSQLLRDFVARTVLGIAAQVDAVLRNISQKLQRVSVSER